MRTPSLTRCVLGQLMCILQASALSSVKGAGDSTSFLGHKAQDLVPGKSPAETSCYLILAAAAVGTRAGSEGRACAHPTP